MSKIEQLADILRSILSLLRIEKEALIKNDGAKIATIVEQKSEYIESLVDFKGLPIREDQGIMDMIQQINDLQETNSLLTKQALNFQNNLLESMAKSAKDNVNTYSPKGNYEKNSNASLIDQSV